MVFQNDLKIIFIDVYLTREWSGLTLISEFSEFSATAWKVSKYGVFFWSVFSRIRSEYGDLLRKSPYSVRMWKNMDQKKTPYLDTSRSAH